MSSVISEIASSLYNLYFKPLEYSSPEDQVASESNPRYSFIRVAGQATDIPKHHETLTLSINGAIVESGPDAATINYGTTYGLLWCAWQIADKLRLLVYDANGEIHTQNYLDLDPVSYLIIGRTGLNDKKKNVYNSVVKAVEEFNREESANLRHDTSHV